MSATVVCTSFAPRSLVLIAGAVMTAPTSARADVPAPVAVAGLLADPAQLAARLRDQDPIVEAARDRVAAAIAQGAQARVLPNPALSAEIGGLVLGRGNKFQGVTGPTSPADTSNVTVGIGELFELGKRGPRAAAADARAREASEVAVGTLGTRLGEATSTLGKLAYVTARRDVVVANLEAARKLRDLEKVRLDHNDLAPVDYERIELDTQALELQLRRVESDVKTALADCRVTLHAPCSSDGLGIDTLDVAAPLPAQLPEPGAAIAARPARVASRLEANALDWEATLAEHRKIPDPTFGVSYTFDNYEYGGAVPSSLTFSVGIPLPLFDRGHHDAQAARATAHAVEAEDQAEVREAEGAVEALFAQRAALTDMLATLEHDAVPKSTKIIAETRKAFDLGQVRLNDLLMVERAHRDLLLEVLDTRFELFGVRGQLRQALGLDDSIARSVQGRAP